MKRVFEEFFYLFAENVCNNFKHGDRLIACQNAKSDATYRVDKAKRIHQQRLIYSRMVDALLRSFIHPIAGSCRTRGAMSGLQCILCTN